jgi:hypothetical protein
MLKKLEHLDERVLRLCTQFAHWFQRLTGRTNYFLAKIGVTMAAVSLLILIANYYFKFLPVFILSPSWLLLGIVMITSLLHDAYCLDKSEKAAQLSTERVRDPLMLSSSPAMRLLCLFPSILCTTMSWILFIRHPIWEVFMMVAVIMGLINGATIFLYFTAVDPLPPGTSKVRQWIAGIASALRPRTPVRSRG